MELEEEEWDRFIEYLKHPTFSQPAIDCMKEALAEIKRGEKMKVLLSIKPEYAEKILNGDKKWEYRINSFRNSGMGVTPVDTIYMYASRPKQKIVGKFTIGKTIRASPTEVWDETSKDGGISYYEFFRYTQGKKFINAYEVVNPVRFVPPVDPWSLNPNFKPATSFSYTTLNL